MILLVSNGPTEDAIGAAIATKLGQFSEIWALPLVGEGRHYEGVAQKILGPRKTMPSGGFVFGSWSNLIADLRAGFLQMTWQQWSVARQTPPPRAVIVVGDAYALTYGLLAHKGAPIFHVNPLVSAHYLNVGFPRCFDVILDWGGSDFTLYERWLHRRVQAVFVRDEATQERLKKLGVPQAFYYGSFAMDLLPEPQKDLSFALKGMNGLALLPGTRGDERFSLPIMLEASLGLPLTPLVAWSKRFEDLPPLPDWSTTLVDEDTLLLKKGGQEAWVMRRAFSEILHVSTLAFSTSGTAAEQAAGLGLPVLGFPTPGPQYTWAFARRQKRLLGEALFLTSPDPTALRDQAIRLLKDDGRYQIASLTGRYRIGPPGGIKGTTQHVMQALQLG
ncbi:MAG: lipid-A-disaccharide synthase-related protein [Thermaceae bacterium]